MADARMEMEGVASRLAYTYPDDDGGRTVLVHPLRDEYLGDARAGILLLAGAGAVVLLLVCANLAAVALAATWAPALRASRVHPMEAIQRE